MTKEELEEATAVEVMTYFLPIGVLEDLFEEIHKVLMDTVKTRQREEEFTLTLLEKEFVDARERFPLSDGGYKQ